MQTYPTFSVKILTIELFAKSIKGSETNTRCYHGLPVAAFCPPAVRILLVAKLDITVRYRGQEYRRDGCMNRDP